MTVAGTGEPAPAGIVMNIVLANRTGVLAAIVLTAMPPVTDPSLTHGAGPAAVANGHGESGTAPITSPTVSTGAPPTITVGAVLGMIWKVPPCEHMMVAL